MSVLESVESRVNGRWTKEEHQKFLTGLELFGRNWKKIEELVGTRNGSQIRSHAQKFFLKVKKTFEENQNVEIIQDSQFESENSKLLSRKQTIVEQDNMAHSFFMNEIIRKTAEQPELNFWEMFIDTGDSKIQGETVVSNERKGSFAFLDSGQGREETPIDCFGIKSH